MKLGVLVRCVGIAWLGGILPGKGSPPEGSKSSGAWVPISESELAASGETAWQQNPVLSAALESSESLATNDLYMVDVIVVPDVGGTIRLFSLGLAALAGIGWVRCRDESVVR